MDKIISKDDPNGIIEGSVCELVFEVSDDLGIGLQEADDIVRSTELFMVLSSECILPNDYNLDSLLLILRKELIRDGKYPIQDCNREVEDFSNFVKAMRHEIVYNCAMYKNLKLNLTQVSLLIEDIENFVVDKNTMQTVKDISEVFNKYVHHLEPVIIGRSEVDRTNSFNEIWWRFNANLQVLLAHCKKNSKRPAELTTEEIDLYVSKELL